MRSGRARGAPMPPKTGFRDGSDFRALGRLRLQRRTRPARGRKKPSTPDSGRRAPPTGVGWRDWRRNIAVIIIRTPLREGLSRRRPRKTLAPRTARRRRCSSPAGCSGAPAFPEPARALRPRPERANSQNRRCRPRGPRRDRRFRAMAAFRDRRRTRQGLGRSQTCAAPHGLGGEFRSPTISTSFARL